jgi:hypothetical protein
MAVFVLALVASGSLLSSYDTDARVVLDWQEAYFPQMPADVEPAHVLPRDSVLATLAKVGLDDLALTNLDIQTRRGDGRQVQVTIRYFDADATRASTVVNELAEQCAVGHRRAAQRRLQQALQATREQIERAQREKVRLDEELGRALKEILTPLKLSAGSWESDPWRKRLRTLAVPPRAAGDGTVLASAEAPVDPEEIRQELAAQEKLLQQLEEKMTPQHPRVVWLKLDIERLKAKLLSAASPDAPPTIAPSAISAPTSPAKAKRARPGSGVVSPLRSSEAEAVAAARIEEYRERFARLNAAHQTLAQTESDAWRQYRDLDDARLAQIEPARRSVQLDRPRWQRFLALMAVLSASCGFGAVMLANRGDVAFISPGQVRRQLPVPLLGVLARSGAAKYSPGRLAYVTQRGVRIGCECLLAATALWLVALAALDHAFLNELQRDPLAAVALACRRMLG